MAAFLLVFLGLLLQQASNLPDADSEGLVHWKGSPRVRARLWNQLAAALSSDGKTQRFAAASRAWRDQLRDAVWRGAPGIRQAEHVLTVFSGADISSALALGGRVRGVVLVSENPALTEAEWRAWEEGGAGGAGGARWCGWCSNATAAAALAAASGDVLGAAASRSFQYGHLIRAFAGAHGMLPLLLAAMGAEEESFLVAAVAPFASEGLRGLLFHCRWRGRGTRFAVRYVEASLHEGSSLAALRRKLGSWDVRRVLTIVKAAEAGLTLLRTDPSMLPGVAPERVAAIAAEEAAHNEGVRAATRFLQDVSSFVAQDATGMGPEALRDFSRAGGLEAFGRPPGPADSGGSDSRRAALRALFLRANATGHAHALGPLGFGVEGALLVACAGGCG